MNDARQVLIGRKIDGCTVTRWLGEGNQSLVFEVAHDVDQERYALKVLAPARVTEELTVERFFGEAQTLARLDHPSVPQVFNLGHEEPWFFMRMNLIEGETARARVQRDGPLSWREAVRAGADLAGALEHAHEQGLLHTDIGPHHMLLGRERSSLIGFHLAHDVRARQAAGARVVRPAWMAPEQGAGKPLDARADIYSLGVTLYYLLSGVRAFAGKDLNESLQKHCSYMPEPLQIYLPELPAAASAPIERCLQKEKLSRYQAAGELEADLRAALRD